MPHRGGVDGKKASGILFVTWSLLGTPLRKAVAQDYRTMKQAIRTESKEKAEKRRKTEGTERESPDWL